MSKIKYWIPIWGYCLYLKTKKHPYYKDRMVFYWEIYQTLISTLIVSLGIVMLFLLII